MGTPLSAPERTPVTISIPPHELEDPTIKTAIAEVVTEFSKRCSFLNGTEPTPEGINGVRIADTNRMAFEAIARRRRELEITIKDGVMTITESAESISTPGRDRPFSEDHPTEGNSYAEGFVG